jgi:2-polyprenyl-3-methyl-5-hydroxy-6-metoxy-1,4-benzoquinol methylase
MLNEEIQEELFCLKFENKALADIYFRDEAERWVYSYMYDITEKEHLERYNYVKDIAENKKVLDIACGSGYGSYLIAKEGKAKEVIAVDLNSDSIRYGNHRFGLPNIKRFVADAQEFIQNETFDMIVSFETIEHLPKYEQFLQNMSKTLTKDGRFFVSTPIVKSTTTTCKNPYHVIEWSFADFHLLIEKYFKIESIYLQNIEFKRKKTFFGKLFQNKKNKYNRIEFEKYSNQFEIDKIKHGYQMLVCSKKNK